MTDQEDNIILCSGLLKASRRPNDGQHKAILKSLKSQDTPNRGVQIVGDWVFANGAAGTTWYPTDIKDPGFDVARDAIGKLELKNIDFNKASDEVKAAFESDNKYEYNVDVLNDIIDNKKVCNIKVLSKVQAQA